MPTKTALGLLLLLAFVLTGCAGGSGGVSYRDQVTDDQVTDDQVTDEHVTMGRLAGARAGTTPVAITLVKAWENVASEIYYPFEGLSGCTYTADGSLLICDEKRGRLFGLDSGTGRWFEFDAPMVRPFRPVDVVVDGFKILALDAGTRTVQRFDLNGTHQDQAIDFRILDPGSTVQPTSFALDRDGRMVITDVDQQQVLLLDTFLDLNSRLGGPGVQDDQFRDPGGIAFMPDGRIVIADTGNGRLVRYGRMGFFESTAGGRFDSQNPFKAPSAVAADRHGNLFVTDLIGGRIHVLGRDMRPLPVLVPEDFADGLAEGPVDIALGPAGQLAVVDRTRQAILVFQILYE